MMHYRKGENVEQEITKADLPFHDSMPSGQKDFLWMHVKGGTKVNNVLSFAKDALDKGEYRTVVWSGSGGGVVKTISCAEILKRSHPLYQVTRMCYTTVEEHWKPQMDGLEEIIANRQIPCLHILMSLDAIDDCISGLQKPNTKTDFWIEPNTPAPAFTRRNNNRPQQQRQAHQKRQQYQSADQNQGPHQTKQQQAQKEQSQQHREQQRQEKDKQTNQNRKKFKSYQKQPTATAMESAKNNDTNATQS